MLKATKSVVIAGVMALGLAAGTASADPVPINGAISFSDGFTSVGPAGSIVSLLTTFDVKPVANTDSCGGNFAGCAATASASVFSSPAIVGTIYSVNTAAGVFTFTIQSVANQSSTAYHCSAGGLCSDDIKFDIAGTVSGGAGFLPTSWEGSWTAQGSCAGTIAGCTGPVTASWSASISALGHQVPEPGSLALLGLGLSALGFVRRRKTKSA